MDDPYFDPFTLYVYEDVEATFDNIKTEPPNENNEIKKSPSDLVSPDSKEAVNKQTNASRILHIPKVIKDDFSFTQEFDENFPIKAEPLPSPLPETDDRILELIKSEENKPRSNNFGNTVIKLESDDENDDLMIENGLFSSKQRTITNHLENMSQYIPNFKIKENRDDDITIIEDESSQFNIFLKIEKADANIADEDFKFFVESDNQVFSKCETVIEEDFGKFKSTVLLQNGLVTTDGNPIREEISHPLNLSENPAIKALSTVDTSNKTPNQISVLGFSKDTENMDLDTRISKKLIGLSFKELLKSSANRTANTPSTIETVDTDKNNIADVQIENCKCQKSLNGTVEVDLSVGKLRGLIQNKMCKTAVFNKTNDKRDVNVKKRMEKIHDNLRDRNNSKRTQIKTDLGTHQATSTASSLKRKYRVSPNRNSSFLVNGTNSRCNIGKDKAQKVDLRHEQNRRNNYENVSPSMVVPNSKKIKISRNPHNETKKDGLKFCFLNNNEVSESKFKSKILQNEVSISGKSVEKPSTASSSTKNIVDIIFKCKKQKFKVTRLRYVKIVL